MIMNRIVVIISNDCNYRNCAEHRVIYSNMESATISTTLIYLIKSFAFLVVFSVFGMWILNGFFS